jgi:ElaB/YqjD/DUF883 family membrane-anchored ribosome-binding protein
MAERTDLTQSRPGETFERSAEEIRHDIAAKRSNISETVDRLEQRIQRSLDWHEYVAEHPFLAFGIAAGLGVMVSGLFKPRPTPGERITEALAESIEDMTERMRANLDGVIRKPGVAPGRTVKAAITAVASTYVAEFLKQKAVQKLSERYPIGQQSNSSHSREPVDKGGNHVESTATLTSKAGSQGSY